MKVHGYQLFDYERDRLTMIFGHAPTPRDVESYREVLEAHDFDRESALRWLSCTSYGTLRHTARSAQ